MELNELDVQNKISDLCDALRIFLLEKNKRYGNSALEMLEEIKYTPTDGIKIRLTDKLKRVINSEEIRPNDITDIVGYIILLLIANGVDRKDILNQID